ncbi:hypothetical protein V6N13_016003 [Hibiscus sabdariffa]|uniref:Exocyst subunit Exo70 family protein n=1 Tax=Hibiscus sabdariffa TaxID=183260 RepID=A0ABR2CXC0_9ROSI
MVKQFPENYERLAFGNVFASLPKNPTAPMTPTEAKECFRKFNVSFEAAYWKHISMVVPDSKLRDQIKASIGMKLVAVYHFFYNHILATGDEKSVTLFIRFFPEDVGNYLSDLFIRMAGSGSSSLSSSQSEMRMDP